MEGTSQAADGCFGLSCMYYTAINTKELLERIFSKMDNPLLQHNLVKYVKLRITFFSEQPCDGKVHYLISHNITTLLYLQHVVFWHMSHDSNKTPFANNVSDAILDKIKTFSYYYDDFIFRQHVTYITHHALEKLRHGLTL